MSAEGTAFQLKINGIDKTPPSASVDTAAEWDATWEERIDGVGTASVTIQDRTNAGPEFARKRDEIEMFVGTDRVFHGEVTRARLELPPGRPFRRWKITASDYNTILDLRLVGCPDGQDFQTIDNGKTYHPIDPHAHCRATDRLTVEWLFEKYAAMPSGDAIDATTFVRGYINKHILYNKYEKPVMWWTHVTLRQALDELANMGGFPIFYWLDPSDKFHWVNFRDFAAGIGFLPRLMPAASAMTAAPAIITDDHPDGVTSVGGRGLYIEEDANFMPEQAYGTGVTDYIKTASGSTPQGSGFYKDEVRDITKRQVLIDVQALTSAQRNSTLASYLRFNKRGRIKGEVTVGKPDEAVDGWHVGQQLHVIDARVPTTISDSDLFAILSVKGSLSSGNDFRVYTLEFGDAPIGKFGRHYKAAPQRIHKKRVPSTQHKVIFPTTHLRPDTEYTLYSQMQDTAGDAWRQGGVSVTWSMVVQDRNGSVNHTGLLEAVDPVLAVPFGVILTDTTLTDVHGRTAAKLTTGAATDMFYQIHAVSEAQFATPEGPST